MSQGQHTGVVPSLELSEGLLSSTEMEHSTGPNCPYSILTKTFLSPKVMWSIL